jgi:hypothetical protein
MNDFYSRLIDTIKETIVALPVDSELRNKWIETLYELKEFQRNADKEIYVIDGPEFSQEYESSEDVYTKQESEY